MRSKWGPLKVHRMNWKVRFRELTGWRPKNERRTMKNGWKSSRNHPRKRNGSTSAWIFFMETIFLTNFKWISDTRRVEHFCSSLLPLFKGNRRGSLPPSSPRRARLLPPEGGTFWRTSWKAQVGLIAICTHLFTKYTPCLFFTDSFSVTLRNLTNYVTILIFFPYCYETLRIT